jgi:general stress protein 26
VTHTARINRLRRILQGLNVGMLSTSRPDGDSHSRPMLLQDVDDAGHVWLMTDLGSDKTYDISANSRVNLVFISRRHDRFVSVSGVATLWRDPQKIRQLWRPSYRAWYPQGRTDPNIVLLDIEVSTVDYWLVPSSRVVRLLHAAKAFAMRRRYESGHRGRIAIRP